MTKSTKLSTKVKKKVLIVGGSNSIRYTPEVECQLEGKALVERVPDNARSTRYTLERLDSWLGRRRWDLIYFNWGMHDLTRVDGTTPQVPLCEYVGNLEVLVKRLAERATQLIWVTTAFMCEECQPKRKLEDVEAYNRAASEVMTRHVVPVHDLFCFTSRRMELFGDDGLHFTSEGSRIIGAEVATFINGYL